MTFPTIVAYPLAITLPPETILPNALTIPLALRTVVVPGLPKIPFNESTLPLADTNPPVNILPPEILAADIILPVALTKPDVNKLPPIILPDPESDPPEPVVTKLLAVILPVALTTPAVKTLPPVTLPLAFTVPSTLRPVGVKTATLPTPLTATVTLAFAEAMATFEVPLLMLLELVLTPVNKEPLPKI